MKIKDVKEDNLKKEEKAEESEEPVTTVKKRCVNCIKKHNLLKILVVVVCLCVVIQQISVCVKKLIDIPITTYTHFDFNKTIVYPSLTFCREPPYKFKKLEEYGLYAHPRYTSVWNNFNFSNVSLDQLWEDITYTDREFFVQYGLDGQTENVELRPTVGFVHGRCYTMNPKILSTHASRSSGYSITLQHDSNDVATSTSTYPPGYHVHVHYTREPFTEVEVYNGGLVDYLYLNLAETIDVKLKVDEYVMISSSDDPCTYEANYSANACTTRFVWEQVAAEAGCSGPWMISDLPRCNNETAMTKLISTYMNLYQKHECHVCPRFCRSYLYNSFVTNRQNFYTWDSAVRQWLFKTGADRLQTQIYIYFNSMMVSVYEERYNYDWNIFISDLGGSVGFLLGLSVIGIMSILENVWSGLIRPFIKSPKKKDINITNVNEDLKQAQVQEVLKKCNNWNLTNKLDS